MASWHKLRRKSSKIRPARAHSVGSRQPCLALERDLAPDSPSVVGQVACRQADEVQDYPSRPALGQLHLGVRAHWISLSLSGNNIPQAILEVKPFRLIVSRA